jgi:hypothetical protein
MTNYDDWKLSNAYDEMTTSEFNLEYRMVLPTRRVDDVIAKMKEFGAIDYDVVELEDGEYDVVVFGEKEYERNERNDEDELEILVAAIRQEGIEVSEYSLW